MLGNAELMSHIRYFTRAEAHHSESELLKYTGGEKKWSEAEFIGHGPEDNLFGVQVKMSENH